MKNSKSTSESSELIEAEIYNFEYISDQDMIEIIDWIRLIRRIQHKNLMLIKDVILQNSCININFFLPSYGPLDNILNKKSNQYGIVCEALIASMMHQICEGLIYLHYNMSIIHRGVCVNAVYIDAKGVVKLGKFNNCLQLTYGETKSTDFPIKHPNLLPWYSPEFIEQEFYGYSFNSDVYSLGLLLAAVFTGRMPYEDCEPSLILLRKISFVDLPTLDVVCFLCLPFTMSRGPYIYYP